MRIEKLLQQYKSGKVTLAEVTDVLRRQPFEDLGFARVDHHRRMRTGNAEVIYAEGKTPDQVVAIVERIRAAGDRALMTRVTEDQWEALTEKFPRADFHPQARFASVGGRPGGKRRGLILVLAAGTSDLPVAEEAALTAEYLSANRVERAYDVGVAGLHRLLTEEDMLGRARAVIAVAGMEGALPSVAAGLTPAPVIGVPTSVGYGASFGGLAALLGMLNSCASGVAVVNIDGGFAAGYMASLINAR
jgi:NCAIR mutase (PurE)-related protein